MTEPRRILDHIDQIAIAVRDIETAMERYWRTMGVGPWTVYTYGPPLVKEMTYNGQRQDFRIRVAFAQCGSVQLELVQPLEGPSIFADFLARGYEGVQHLGMFVEDIEAAGALMKSAGFRLIQSGRGFGARGDGAFAFFGTDETLSMVIEMIQRPVERVPPDLVFPSAGLLGS